MLHGHDVLILSPSEWQDNAVSNMQIAAVLSECNKVAYVETMGGRVPRLWELGRVLARIKRMLGIATAGKGRRGLDSRNVFIFTPLAIPMQANAVVDWINRRLL